MENLKMTLLIICSISPLVLFLYAFLDDLPDRFTEILCPILLVSCLGTYGFITWVLNLFIENINWCFFIAIYLGFGYLYLIVKLSHKKADKKTKKIAAEKEKEDNELNEEFIRRKLEIENAVNSGSEQAIDYYGRIYIELHEKGIIRFDNYGNRVEMDYQEIRERKIMDRLFEETILGDELQNRGFTQVRSLL